MQIAVVLNSIYLPQSIYIFFKIKCVTTFNRKVSLYIHIITLNPLVCSNL